MAMKKKPLQILNITFLSFSLTFFFLSYMPLFSKLHLSLFDIRIKHQGRVSNLAYFSLVYKWTGMKSMSEWRPKVWLKVLPYIFIFLRLKNKP